MNNLLIYTVAAGRYRDYVPLFKRCLELSYPDYNYIVEEAETENPRLAATLRFLLEPPGNHKYVYTTDVDMFILPETPTLLDFHLNEMDKSGLCYSNARRNKEPRGSERITGLHFVERRPWYDATKEQRRKYFDMIERGEYKCHDFQDEIVLQKIVADSGLKLCERGALSRRHHGLHIGLFKHYKAHTKEMVRTQLNMRITPPAALRWTNNYNDKQFAEIEKETRVKNPEIGRELEALYSFCMKKSKQMATWGKNLDNKR